jgi:TRAP-type C4-dicarboxylate transport system permease small subunit
MAQSHRWTRLDVRLARLAIALLSGWLTWIWFTNLFAAGEAALGGPVPRILFV